MACLLHFADLKGATRLIYAVLVDDIAQFTELAVEYGKARNEFLMSLKSRGRLLLEAMFGERGYLMLLDAASVTDVLTVLQSDPYIAKPVSSRVLIRSLKIEAIGNIELLFRNNQNENATFSVSARTEKFSSPNRK
jgi:uncharacterized protein YciI